LENIGAAVFSIGPVFHIGVDIVAHQAAVGIQIPVDAKSKIVFFSAFNLFIIKIDPRPTRRELPCTKTVVKKLPFGVTRLN